MRNSSPSWVGPVCPFAHPNPIQLNSRHHFCSSTAWLVGKFSCSEIWQQIRRRDKDLFIGPQEFVVGYSKAPEQPQSSARPIWHSHAMTRTGANSHHKHSCIGARCTTHCALGDPGRCCGRQSLGLYIALCSAYFFDSTLCRNNSNESDYVPLNSDTINLQPWSSIECRSLPAVQNISEHSHSKGLPLIT